MPGTKRQLLRALAEKIGGEHGGRMRTALSRASPFDDILDRPMGDEAYALEMSKLAGDLPKAIATVKAGDGEKPASWGLAN